jgi:hypothetical protein
MTIANVSQGSISGLPKALMIAQKAIHLPEVQEMLRRLSEYNLGIFMPHMHDEKTGQFQPLPDELVQVEDGLKVSFRSEADIGGADRYVPIGWVWRQGATEPSARCVMRCIKRPGDSNHYSGHVQENVSSDELRKRAEASTQQDGN